jgi:peroxidase
VSASFADELRKTCNASDPTSMRFAFFDGSPASFDNSYFRSLQNGRGLLGSDQVLYSDGRSRATVNSYAGNQAAFFADFVSAMSKLRRIGVKTAARYAATAAPLTSWSSINYPPAAAG